MPGRDRRIRVELPQLTRAASSRTAASWVVFPMVLTEVKTSPPRLQPGQGKLPCVNPCLEMRPWPPVLMEGADTALCAATVAMVAEQNVVPDNGPDRVEILDLEPVPDGDVAGHCVRVRRRKRSAGVATQTLD